MRGAYRFRRWLLDLWWHTICGHHIAKSTNLGRNRYSIPCSCGGITIAYASRAYGIAFVEESTCPYGLAHKRLDDQRLPPARIVVKR